MARHPHGKRTSRFCALKLRPDQPEHADDQNAHETAADLDDGPLQGTNFASEIPNVFAYLPR